MDENTAGRPVDVHFRSSSPAWLPGPRRASACLIALGLALALTFTGWASTFEKPEIFSELAYADAKARAEKTEKLLILDFMAEWCGPCKQMDRTTWVDERLVEWVNANAIAIQVDVDRDEKTSEADGIQAMPTIVVVRYGKEFDRVVGYRDADQMLNWLNNAKEGKTDLDRLREIAGDRADEEGHVDVQARYELAQTLMRKGEYEEATKEYVWLWKNLLDFDSAFYGVRLSFMLGDIEELMEEYEPARDAFEAIRDKIEAQLREKKKDLELLNDWIHLNISLGDEERILEWFDRVKDRKGIEKAFGRVERDLAEILIKHDRWADVGRIYGNPAAELQQTIAMIQYRPQEKPGEWDDEMWEELKEFEARSLRERAGMLYAACPAADRDEIAQDIADILIDHDDSGLARVALVETALKAGEHRPVFHEWVESADEAGERVGYLRERLRVAEQESESSGGG